MGVSTGFLQVVAHVEKKKRLPLKVTWPRLVISQFRIRSRGEVIHKVNKGFYEKLTCILGTET